MTILLFTICGFVKKTSATLPVFWYLIENKKVSKTKSISKDIVIKSGWTSEYQDSVWCWLISDKNKAYPALSRKGTIHISFYISFSGGGRTRTLTITNNICSPFRARFTWIARQVHTQDGSFFLWSRRINRFPSEIN